MATPNLTFAVSATLALFCMSASAIESGRSMEQRRCNLAPPVDLLYSINAQQHGMKLSGKTSLKWNVTKTKFFISSETSTPLLGNILDEKSEGNIEECGLAPNSFTERRFRKYTTITSFDRNSKLISFSTNAETYPIKGGEQDRNSAIWQLISIARGTHGKLKTNSEWRFFVAGRSDVEAWTFKVDKLENVHTPLGDFNSVHIVKAPPDSKGQQVDIWLSPTLEWYPVRLRFTEPNGDFIEEVLNEVASSTE